MIRSTPGAGAAAALIRTVREGTDGNRNNVLFWAARRAVDENLGEQVLDLIEDAAIATGLPPSEVTRTINSARTQAGAR
ncbi:MAG: hypothetical protein ABI808_10965 [Pseudonocardiales bacterium]